MNIFLDISIDGIDTFCSVLGKELVFEHKNKSNILLPCFNMGFYENAINPDINTKAIDKCYLLFKSILEFNAELDLYESLYPGTKGLIELAGNKINYKIQFGLSEEKVNNYTLEGSCFRNNSFSYGTYTFLAGTLNVVLIDSYLNEYKNNNSFKSNKAIQAFLLNKDIDDSFFEALIKEAI